MRKTRDQNRAICRACRKEALNVAAGTADDIKRGVQFRMGTAHLARGDADLMQGTADHKNLNLALEYLMLHSWKILPTPRIWHQFCALTSGSKVPRPIKG